VRQKRGRKRRKNTNPRLRRPKEEGQVQKYRERAINLLAIGNSAVVDARGGEEKGKREKTKKGEERERFSAVHITNKGIREKGP